MTLNFWRYSSSKMDKIVIARRLKRSVLKKRRLVELGLKAKR